MKTKIFYFVMLMVSSQLFAQDSALLAQNRVSPQSRIPCNDDLVGAAPATADLIAVVDRMNCPDLSQIRNICNAVSSSARVPIPNTDRTQYEYVAMMNAAACIQASDSDSQKRTKIQALWNANQNNFGCTVTGFDVEGGNVLKLVVRKRSFEFLNLAMESWQLNLNIVDPVDGKTVLDYVEAELVANRGSDIGRELQEYKELLIEAGAKRSSEL